MKIKSKRELPRAILKACAEKGINNSELSKMLGWSQPYTSMFLNGKRGITLANLIELCDQLDISLEINW